MNKMKRKSIICMLSLGMMMGMFSTSCQDMLSPNSERHAYTVAEDTLYSYWGILKSLQNIAERYVILNECRGDLVDASGYVSDTIAAIVDFGNVNNPDNWKDGACAYLKVNDYYHIINSCNAYIAKCDLSRTTGTNQSYMIKEYAQVQAIRAWVYMQLLYAYGENRVPFYTEPMLTTDDINNFVADKNHQLLNIDVLTNTLAPELEAMAQVELDPKLGMPAYNNYGDLSSGNGHFVCHSSKCMFPVCVVLGDLYLLSGRYVEAAQSYLNYIRTDECGPLAVDKFHSRAYLDDKLDYPCYAYDLINIPYTEKAAVSRETEAITCIPSNKGKLEGTVLTDVNRLFGFEAQMRTHVGTESSSSSISLSRNYERELIPSKGYEALCDSQKYEVYVGTISDNTFKYESLVELRQDDRPVGDARRAWIYSQNGQQWNFFVGDDIFYGKMVSKQNPGGSFSTTYPVIYRKSTVWLRYAEALNRAGFPSYAFAVLKTGLCDNPFWFPDRPSLLYENYSKAKRGFFLGQDYNPFGYDVKDSLFYYSIYEVFEDETIKETVIPENWQTDEQIHTLADLKAYVENYFQQQYEASLETENPLPAPRQYYETNVHWLPAGPDAFGNTPHISGTALYYLDRRELERSDSPILNFQGVRGQSQSQLIYVKEQGKLFNGVDPNNQRLRFPDNQYVNVLYTIGVHQRGCGFIRYDDPEEYGRSSFNYVSMVQKKIKENTGKEVTEDDIYSGQYDADVKDAVEDLIIDEMGLELAFEGSRFSDLCRVALRRGNPDYLAKRVSKRHTGEVDPKLRSWLQNKDHWFLPIPEE